MLSSAAQACTCGGCQYDEYVSDFVRDHKVFWGIPTESRLEKITRPSGREFDQVVSKVTIVEGYDRHQNGQEMVVTSAPYNYASCGVQLRTGAVQLVIVGPRNTLSDCFCQPPESYLFEYLNEGKDRFLSNPEGCWDEGNEDQEFKDTPECRVWRDAPRGYNIIHDERLRIYKLMNERKKAEASD